ncbi:NAD(P)-binding protein [Nocardioides convexus]|uniref:NAD(P)-binding protein n=1 Tax=Nocardioides convexus TaxID=2712224 RepID=UPI0024187548|nr:NAD(P)-binding protein [Nocardioides convexus]
MTTPRPRHVAVVGSGVAGLTAAYVASRTAHVTLIEADDRIGGHADTHVIPDPSGRMLRIDSGFIVHNRHTYPVLLRLFQETRRPDPGVGDVDVDQRRGHRPGVGRRTRPARDLPARDRQPPQPGVPADAGRDPALPPARPPAARRVHRPRRGPDDARGLPRRRRLLAVLPPALHGAARRGRVVLRPGHRAGLPRGVPVLLPGPPRDAAGLRLPDLAHRQRRLAHLRRRPQHRRPLPWRRGPAQHPGARHPRAPRRGRGDHRRRTRAVRRRRGRHAPRPGPAAAHRAHRGAARGARRDALQPEHRRAAHRRPAAAARGRRLGVVELPPSGGAQRAGARHLRPDPAAAPAHRHPLPRHPRRRAPGRPGEGAGAPRVRAPPLHPGVGRRAAPAAGDRLRPAGLRRGLPRLGLPRGRRALGPAGRRAAGPVLGGAGRDVVPDHVGAPPPPADRPPLRAPHPQAGSSTSTGWTTRAGCPAGAGASWVATTSPATPRACARAWTASSTRTGSTCAAVAP